MVSMIRCIVQKTGWDKDFLVLFLLLLPLVVFFSFSKPWGVDYDFWETAATVRELSVNFFHPSNPILRLPGDTSPRFVPYTMFWGLFKKITYLGIFATMGIAGVINYFIFIFGLYRFISKQFKIDSLPTYTLGTMLLIWGSGYTWANAYHLEMFFVTLPYVGFFAFGLSLNALYYLNCYCEENKWRHLFFYSLLSVISFVTHPITGAFCFVAALALLVTYENFKRAVFLQGVVLLAFGSSLIWPYFNYWDTFTNGVAQDWFESPLFSGTIGALGSSVMGFSIVAIYALRGKYMFLLYGLLLCSFIYIISRVADILIGGRFIFFSAFFLHLAIALYINQNKILSLKKIWDSFRTDGLAIIVIFMLLAPSGIYRVKEMRKHIFRFHNGPSQINSYNSPAKPYLFLSKHLSYGDVLLVNAHEGWVVPAITGARVVAPQKLNPLMAEESNQRKRDVAKFFKSRLSSEDRIRLITKYSVTHILINHKNERDWDPSLRNQLKVIGLEEASENSLILYKVAKSIGSI
ncbi:MAG: hypothetical protein ACFFCW_31900 [Candidatus Hodarchaeota archaeon]